MNASTVQNAHNGVGPNGSTDGGPIRPLIVFPLSDGAGGTSLHVMFGPLFGSFPPSGQPSPSLARSIPRPTLFQIEFFVIVFPSASASTSSMSIPLVTFPLYPIEFDVIRLSLESMKGRVNGPFRDREIQFFDCNITAE